jgi:lipid II:glycine glycyltransferase (peptidoglycan interpeptide bridge formation enzyme)
MTIKISNIRPANHSEWDRTWEECDYATYFQSREWAEIWENYTNGKCSPKAKIIVFSDGKKVVLPLSVEKQLNGLSTCYVSSPAGTFGGWISLDNLSEIHVYHLTNYLITKCKNLIWRINPYNNISSHIISVKNQLDETHFLDLRQGFDATYKKNTKGNARAVNKAKREGVSIKSASNIEDWLLYYQIYENSLLRWGDQASSRYSKSLFEEMFQKNSPNIKLWLAVYQEKIIAGAVCFYAKKHAAYWHGAALSDFFNLRPVNLLMWEAIKDASDRKFSWFDFNPSGKNEGVRAFKRSFGAASLDCSIIRSNRISTVLLQQGKKLVERLIP